MMIPDRAYQEAYRIILMEMQANAAQNINDESAIPSYINDNWLMSWVFWKRIFTAFSLAGNLANKTVLDFGCGAGVTFKYLWECHSVIVGCDNKYSHLTQSTCARFGIKAEIHQNLFQIKGRKFDYIFALDVFEHIQDLSGVVDHLLSLSNDRTVLVVSGPTENVVYKLGRKLAGFSGDYHVRNIYEIEKFLRQKGLRNKGMKVLRFPFPLFRVSTWTF